MRRLAILEGRIHERRLVRAEIDLVMPGGRVAAWSWQREGGSSVPVAMVIPPGTTLEAMLVDDTGVPSRLRLELDMPTHGRAAPEGLFALELASERPPWLRGGRRGSDEVTPLAETLPHGDLTLFLELERQPSRIPVETAPTGSPQERSTENDHDV